MSTMRVPSMATTLGADADDPGQGSGREAAGALQALDLLDRRAGLDAGVERDLAERLLDGLGHETGTGGFVALELLGGGEHGGLRAHERHAAAGDDALLDRRLGGGDGVL